MSVGKVTALEKCPSENCPLEKCPSEKCPSEKCPTTWKMASHHVFVTVFLVPEFLDFGRNLFRCVETQLKYHKKMSHTVFCYQCCRGKTRCIFFTHLKFLNNKMVLVLVGGGLLFLGKSKYFSACLKHSKVEAVFSFFDYLLSNDYFEWNIWRTKAS